MNYAFIVAKDGPYSENFQDMVIDRAGKHLDPRTMEFRALLKVVKNEKKKLRSKLRAAAVAEKRAARIAAKERVK